MRSDERNPPRLPYAAQVLSTQEEPDAPQAAFHQAPEQDACRFRAFEGSIVESLTHQCGVTTNSLADLSVESGKRFYLETLVINSITRTLTCRTTAAVVAALSLKLILQASGQQPSAAKSPQAAPSPAHFGTWGVDLI